MTREKSKMITKQFPMSEGSPREKRPDTVVILFLSVLGWTVAVVLSVAGGFSAKHLGFSNMIAAQVSLGLFGLAGGFSHSLLIRAVGGKASRGGEVSRKQDLFLSIVWALSCIGGVTPLFFTFGTDLKMAMLSFYSFAIFGAFGGAATAFVLRSFFDNASSRDVVPCTLLWAFSFGLATVTSEIIGEKLQAFLPALIAWSVAFGVMALIIGVGGGYSIVNFLGAGSDGSKVLKGSGIDYSVSSEGKNKRHILVLILLFVPFYLNDFSDIYVTDWRLWLLIDYTAVKLFPLLVVLWLICSKKMHHSEFGLNPQPLIPFVTAFLIGTLAVTLILQNGYMTLSKFPGYPPLGGMPDIESPLWNWIDLTFGLLMVGIFEELVFRGYLHTFLTRYIKHPLVIICISAIGFGFIHWSGGFHKVIVTSASGAVFMLIYFRTRSLPAVMLAHFVVNFIEFSNVIPKYIFRFL